MNLIKAILTKELLYFWRYRVNALFSILFMTIICLSIIFGYGQVIGFDEGKEKSIIASFFLWMIMMLNFNTINNNISSEATNGTLEQLYLNSSSYVLLLLYKNIIVFIINLLPIYVVVGIISVIANINIDGIFLILPIVILGIPSIWGISLMTGGLILMFKQINTVLSASSAILFAAITYFSSKLTIFGYLIPFSKTKNLSLSILSEPYFSVEYYEYVVVLLNSVCYLTLGILFFKFAEGYAKKNGTLGHY